MNIELIRTFLEVERLRHFGRAARELHVTQAAVSARIRQLEDFFGAPLFDRATRDTQLTPAGNRFLRHAEALLAEWRKARQAIALDGAAEQLAIGGSPRLWSVLLQPWLERLRVARPELAVLAESQSAEQLNRSLLDGVLDFAVMLDPAQLHVLQIRPVAELDLIMVTTSKDASVEQALRDGYVYVDWGLAHATAHRRLFPDAPESRTRVPQPQIARSLLQSVGGSAYLPSSWVAEDLALGRLQRVADAPAMSRTAFAVYPVRTGRLELIESCLEYFS